MDRKVKFLKDWIERNMLEHDWFNGVEYVDTEPYQFRNKKITCYVFYLDTGGFGVTGEFEDSFDSIFKVFFPTGSDYDPTAVWYFRYV